MAEPTKQLAFAVDQEILDVIEQLKKDLGTKTTASVFRKSLAIAKIAAEQARDSGGIVTLRGREQSQKDEISVALRA
jgi:ABC-type phosphonate transport system ATPase subunit